MINFPHPGDLDKDGYINPATFREVFAADVPVAQAAVMAASQRPGTLSSLAAPSGVPAADQPAAQVFVECSQIDTAHT